jgi:hypothetical protein
MRNRDLRIDRGSNPVLREENRKQDWTDGQRKVRQCVWGGGGGRRVRETSRQEAEAPQGSRTQPGFAEES